MKSSIKDVARRAGVSIATVSHVVNNTKNVTEETRMKVLSAIQGLNYKPNSVAQSLRGRVKTTASIYVKQDCLEWGYRLVGDCISQLSGHFLTQGVEPSVRFQPPDGDKYCTNDDHNIILTGSVRSGKSCAEFFPNCQVLDISLLPELAEAASQRNLHLLSYYYYSQMIKEMDEDSEEADCYLLGYRQGEIFKQLFRHSPDYNKRMKRIIQIPPETMAGYAYLRDLICQGRYRRIYLLEEALAYGAVRLFIKHPRLANHRVKVIFFNYNSSFCSMGTPVAEEFFTVQAPIYQIFHDIL